MSKTAFVKTLPESLLALELPVVSVETRPDGLGFWATFANQMTLSVQWHGSSYSNVGRHNWSVEDDDDGDFPTFEVAAWYPGESLSGGRNWFMGDFYRFAGDTVLPYVEVGTMLMFACKVAEVCRD